jgi:hypothetical protein
MSNFAKTNWIFYCPLKSWREKNWPTFF